MSADNYLGVFKINENLYQGHSVWSEDKNPREHINILYAKFSVSSLEQAVIEAEKEMQNIDSRYEYGIRFFL